MGDMILRRRSSPAWWWPTATWLQRTLRCAAVCGACAWLLGAGLPAQAEPREVRLGVYANEPKIFLGDDGEPSGIFGDWVAEIARREGWVLRPVPCEWQACLEALQAGSIDLMPDVAYSEARARRFDFHPTPALHSWSQVYARPGSGIDSMLDLQGRRVAVLSGSVQETFLRGLVDSFGVEVQWRPVAGMVDGFELVADGQADVVVASHLFGHLQAPRQGLEPTPIMFQPVRLFYVTAPGRNTDLLEAIERYIDEWKTQPDSVYHEVLARWGVERPEPRVPQAFWWAMAGVGALLLAALAGAFWLRRQVEEKTRSLRASEEKLNTILDSVEACIYIKNTDGRYAYVNRKVCELLGQPRQAILGHTDSAYFDPETARRLEDNDRRVLRGGERVEAEETNRLRGAPDARTFLSVKLPLRHADGGIYALCGISTDITEHKKNQEEIHRLAFYDPLTLLPNRRLLLDRLQQSLAASARSEHDGALLFIDLDNFKSLNDTLGHIQGDDLLRQVAARLGGHVREEDTVARLGGDEFVVMLRDLSPQREVAARQAEVVARKVQAEGAQPYRLGEHLHQATVSIGVSLFSDATGGVEELLKLADMALYEAKAQGRNTIRFFNPKMQAEVQDRVQLENDLRTALAQGQFLLHYQPQVDAQGRILGAEALLRWQHPQRGMVLPAQFIGVAEACELILPLGRWVLQTACEQLVRWAASPATAGWKLAVNVSARQFRQPEFAGEVLEVLRATGARAPCLELELTESQLVDDFDNTITRMSALQAQGVGFSLDDFGTGYSSLSYIKRLPLRKLKIDQSFVRDVLTDANDAAIVRTIVALGDSLGLDVIAEGVETEDQRDALAALGCVQYQGYLFGRPAPASALEARWT